MEKVCQSEEITGKSRKFVSEIKRQGEDVLQGTRFLASERRGNGMIFPRKGYNMIPD